TSYAVHMAALRETRRRGAEDVIFTSTDSYVLEGPTSTVVLRAGNELLTPATDQGILAGTTQELLFRFAADQGIRAVARPVLEAELRNAEHVWLCSSVRLCAPVRAMDGRSLPIDTARPDQFLGSARRAGSARAGPSPQAACLRLGRLLCHRGRRAELAGRGRRRPGGTGDRRGRTPARPGAPGCRPARRGCGPPVRPGTGHHARRRGTRVRLVATGSAGILVRPVIGPDRASHAGVGFVRPVLRRGQAAAPGADVHPVRGH